MQPVRTWSRGLRSLRTIWSYALVVPALLFLLPGCEFDSVAFSVVPHGHRLIIQDPVPAGADCEQRSHEMMWLIHRWDWELGEWFPGLVSTVNSDVTTPNGNVCEYRVNLLVRHPEHIITLPWFVLAMDESGWVAECETPLVQETPEGRFPMPPITFVRGEPGCQVGG